MNCGVICEHNAWGAAPVCMKPEQIACPMAYQEMLKKEQEAKADDGKLEIDLVPMQIVRDISEVRMYGTKKYGDPENWRRVELRRYVNALLRHTLAFAEDIHSVDEESGIPHYKHMECNMAFISELLRQEKDTPMKGEDRLLLEIFKERDADGRAGGKAAESPGE